MKSLDLDLVLDLDLDLWYTYPLLLHDVLKDNKISDEGEDYKQL